METLIFRHVTLTPSDMPTMSLGQPACFSLENTVLKGCTMIWVTLFGRWPEDPLEDTCGSVEGRGQGGGKEEESETA